MKTDRLLPASRRTPCPKSFHGDPADRLIVATARARKLPLATRDAAIRKSRALKLWKV